MIHIYYNNRCGKCRTALTAVEKTGEEFKLINYLTESPSIKVLEMVLAKLQLEPIDIVRTKEAIYKEKFAHNKYTRKEWLKILHENPILIERPIIIKDQCAVIARSEEKLNEILKSKNDE